MEKIEIEIIDSELGNHSGDDVGEVIDAYESEIGRQSDILEI